MSRILFILLLLIVTQLSELQAAAFSVRQNRFDEVPDLQTPAPLATSTESSKKPEKGWLHMYV